MSSSNEKLRPRLVAIAVIAAGAVAGGCEGCEPSVTRDGSDPTTNVVESEIRECPHTWTWDARYDQEPGATIENDLAALTRGAHHVPEYNDCQRFVIEQGKEQVYSDGQFAIFAVQNDSLLDALNDGHGVAVAVIFAEDDYALLGIQEHFNCLVLQAEGEGWAAAMYKPGSDEIADCSGPFRKGSGHQLTVKPPISPLPADSGHYARLARWGYDIDRRAYYMTVTCGEAVCHIGPAGDFVVATPPTPTTTANAMERRVHDVATWHDQQLLAELEPSTNSLQPTEVWGTVIPHHDLGNLNELRDFRSWVTVAEVEMSADHDDYAEKGFRMTTPGGDRNIVQSCVITTDAGGNVTRNECRDLPDDFLPGSGKCDASDEATPGESWRSRHIPVDGETKYFCVKRYPLPVNGLEVPAAARWRWRADDELVWYRCMWGCCDEQV